MLDEGLHAVKLSELHESPENPRTITDQRYEELKYSLEHDPSMLAARPIIATPEGEIVCGNIRHRALSELGASGVVNTFVKRFESDAQKREWMLRDNEEYGDWVPEELAALIAAHRDEQADLKLLGFGEPQLESLLKQHDGDGGSPGGDRTTTTPEVWGVVVECETEDEQAALTEELSERGLSVRALIP